jgi:hypothetical protein
MKTRRDWNKVFWVFADVTPWAAATAVMVIGFAWTTESAIITCCFLMCFIGWVVLKVVREELKRPAHAPHLHRSILDKAEIDEAIEQTIAIKTQCIDRAERNKDDAKYCMEAGRTYWVNRYTREGMSPNEIEFAEAMRQSHFEKHCDPDVCYFCLLREKQVPYV